MSKTPFFSEFPPVTTEEWEEHIRRDLRGDDYADRLLWHLPDGITVRPYYRMEDLEALEPMRDDRLPDVAMPATFLVRQDVATPDIEQAREHVAAALEGEVDILGISLRVRDQRCTGVPLIGRDAFEAFAAGLPLDKVRVHLDAEEYSPSLLALFLNCVGDRAGASDVAFTVAFDPIAAMARSGRRMDGALDLAADMVEIATRRFPHGRVLQIGAVTFHEAGATPVQEIAFVLASAAELFEHLIERGLLVRDVVRHVFVAMPVATSYFVEIAKLRALRLTCAQLIDAFLPGEAASLPPIHGETSMRSLTLYDPHTNMLRATTAAASAVTGGCDVVSVRPFDEASGRFDEFSYRMARNVGHLLRHEAGMDRVVDPGAGSYYVEVLTDAIARRAWQLFQDVEVRSGLLKAIESGYVQTKLEDAQSARSNAFAERRRVLIGSNLYPDPSERRNGDLVRAADTTRLPPPRHERFSGGFDELSAMLAAGEPITVMESLLEGPRLGSTLRLGRDAEAIEAIRLRTERSGRTPRILLALLGDPSARRRKAHFAANFLECAGFRTQTSDGTDTVEEVLAAAQDSRPDAVVFCTSDADLNNVLNKVSHERKRSSYFPLVGIVASNKVLDDLDDRMYDFAIGSDTNLVEALSRLQQQFGIYLQPEEVRP